MLRLVLISICLFFTACAAVNLKEGINSFKLHDYRQAFIRLKPEALKGHPGAQYAVGYMYYYGEGVNEDRKKALYWINQAAAAGQSDAVAALEILNAAEIDRVTQLEKKSNQ